MLGGFQSLHRCTSESNRNVGSILDIEIKPDDMFICCKWALNNIILSEAIISTMFSYPTSEKPTQAHSSMRQYFFAIDVQRIVLSSGHYG